MSEVPPLGEGAGGSSGLSSVRLWEREGWRHEDSMERLGSG